MRRIITSLLVVGVVTAAGIGASQAFFSDTETSSGNVLSAGTFQIDVDGNSDGTFDINLAKVTGLMPGDKTGEAKIVVKNNGNVDMATFGQFTLSGIGGTSLDEVLKFYTYKVDYFDQNGAVARWASDDPYYGLDNNEDWFIKDGNPHSQWVAYGGKHFLNEWVFGNGPLDVPGTSWDMEGLKPGEYYEITFELQMDPFAGNTYQGEDVTIGYVVKATQIDTDAINALGLGGQLNDFTYVNNNVLPYLETQVGI